MLWAALATLIITLSGFGDDARAIEWFLNRLSHSIEEHVASEGRRARALDAIGAIRMGFISHREKLQEVGQCLERADADYLASPRDYQICTADLGRESQKLVAELQQAGLVLEENLTPEEWQLIRSDIVAGDHWGYVDSSLKSLKLEQGKAVDNRRLPGLSGVYARRHITIARNAAKIVSGPLAQQTFGQRYYSGSVSAGGSYQQFSKEAARWQYRAGVGFGLYEDIEIGALFLPFEFKPEVKTTDILVFFSYQFRSEHIDTALRFSLLSPENRVLPINPGLSLLFHDDNRRLEVAALLPMNISRSEPTAGFNLPLRASYNLTPHLFMSIESGYAWQSFNTRSHSTPAGVGLGYTLVLGQRVLDLTTLLRVDELVDWGGPNGAEFNASDYRLVFGFNLQNMVF